jgi:rare lipoprotein A
MEQGLAISAPARRAAPVMWMVGGMIAASLTVAGCSTIVAPSPSIPRTTPLSAAPGGTQVVTASWYGNEFSGRRTSNGEVFDPNQLTAASRSLPMGSRVRVTNMSNGRTVVVRINDRGPYVRGRSLDLSHAAAQHIGLTHRGVGRVQIARVDTTRSQPPPTAVSRVSYTAPVRPRPRWRSIWPHSTRIAGRRRRPHRRIVSNPIGHWILSALPGF